MTDETESPAELILQMTETDVLRIAFQRNQQVDEHQNVDLYIWICSKTNLYKGLNIVAGNRLSLISDSPLNRSQIIQRIFQSGHQAGEGICELLSDIEIDDLQRLYRLNTAAV